MELTAANTAIVVDSTADFPQAPERFPNWRIVPLYVRFGEESYRDYVELSPADFYARLRTSLSVKARPSASGRLWMSKYSGLPPKTLVRVFWFANCT